jgi:hypothetical protein
VDNQSAVGMSTPKPEGQAPGSTWSAVAWAEACLVLGLVFGTFAIASSFQSCDFLGGCGPDESSLTAASVVWLILGGGALVAGAVMAALRSGWLPRRAVLQAVIAIAVAAFSALGGFALAGLLVDEYGPGLVLAVGIGGAVAIRPPVARATRVRAVIVGLLFLVALIVANETVATVAVLFATLPLLGLGDALSAPRSPRTA